MSTPRKSPRKPATTSVPKTPTKSPSKKAKDKQKAANQGSDAEDTGVEDEVKAETCSPQKKRRGKPSPVKPATSLRSRLAIAEDPDSESGSSTGGEGEYGLDTAAVEDNLEGFVKFTSADAYFLAQAKPAKTSANRLSSRPGPNPWTKFSPASYLESLAAWESTEGGKERQRVREGLAKSYESRWGQWYFELSEGFTLLLHGLGSKRKLVNHFATQVLQKDGNVVVVNGFQHGVTITEVLDAVEAASLTLENMPPTKARTSLPSFDALEARTLLLIKPYSSPEDFVQPLDPSKSRLQKPLYLILHNIDGPALRTPRAQTALTILASAPGIRLLATIDHIHGMLLFPTDVATSGTATSRPARGYSFLHHHTPTYEPYTYEALFDGTISRLFPPPLFAPTIGSSAGASSNRAGKRGLATAKGILHVLASLTDRANTLFKILATRQIDFHGGLSSSDLAPLHTQLAPLDANTVEGSVAGRTPPVASHFTSLFSAAKDAFVVSAEAQLEALLQEFRDHGVISGNQEPPEAGEPGEEGEGEWLWICAERRVLEEVLDGMAE